MGGAQLGQSSLPLPNRHPPPAHRSHPALSPGTWQTLTNLPASSLIPISSTPPLSPAQLATLSINPPTALRMLSDFVPLNPATPNYKAPAKKQWVIQNGANSAVGISAIQLCREWGVGTVNLVRSRYARPFCHLVRVESRARLTQTERGSLLAGTTLTSSRLSSQGSVLTT